MARQLQALGRALYGVTSLASGRAAGAAAPSGFGGLRAFGTTVGDLPAKGSAGAPEQTPAAEASRGEAAAPTRPKMVVVKRSEQGPEAQQPQGGYAAPLSVEPPRLHPLRLFYPGQTYKPEELDGAAPDAAAFVHRPSQKTRQLHKRGEAANAELYATADFRNGRLLNGFVSEAGKLLPRRTNKVDAKVQRKLVRAVKTARMMAILPYTERLPSFAKGRKNPYS